MDEAVSADKESATEVTESFKIFIERNDYNPQQVFNADETRLFFKRLPRHIYIWKKKKLLPVSGLPCKFLQKDH